MHALNIGIDQVCECCRGESGIISVYGNLAERIAIHIVGIELNGSLTLLLTYHYYNCFLAAILKVN